VQYVHKVYNYVMIDEALIRTFFATLELEPEIADIYIALYTHGPQTISELARNSGIERTRIYRLSDKIASSGLIELETQYKRTIYKAAPISNIQILITKKEQQLRALKSSAPKMTSMFSAPARDLSATKVQFYYGADGAKQVFWNQTKATTETVAILHENMQNKTGASFFERWVHRCNERQLKHRGIISDAFIATQKDWYRAHNNERLANWEAHYMPDATFPITHSTIVYDNVTVHYNWRDAEVFALEIYNRLIADTHRRYFELLWRLAQPVNDLAGPREA